MNPEDIKTRQELINYILILQKELSEDPSKWENNNLESFLRALADYLNDIEGYYKNNNKTLPKNIDWSVFAIALKGASLYE